MTTQAAGNHQGPLAGLKVVEFMGLGPAVHCAMLLADLGAEVLRFERPSGNAFENAILDRGRHIMQVDLQDDADRALCRRAVAKADVVIEGFRPGVMERLGLDPAQLLQENPRLIVARLTGWGQQGPLAPRAGHDINYIALAGALAHIRPVDGLPVPPQHLVGDYGGGSLYAAFGIMAALWERERSGRGQVIDAAIVDGVAASMSLFTGFVARGTMSAEPRKNILGGAAPFYRCYRCADGRELAVGAIEPHFYAELLRRIGAPESFLAAQNDTDRWPEQSQCLADLFAQKTRQEWCELFAGADVCVAPVLGHDEAPLDEHLMARGTFVERDGLRQHAPAPRFSRTPGAIQAGGAGAELLRKWGVDSQAPAARGAARAAT